MGKTQAQGESAETMVAEQLVGGFAELGEAGYLLSHNTSKTWQMNRYHFHDFYEVNLVLSDGVSFFIGDQVYEARRGMLLIFSDMDLHRSVSAPDVLYERYVLYFDQRLASRLSSAATDLIDCFRQERPGFSHCLQLAEEDVKRLILLLLQADQCRLSSGFGSDLRRNLCLTEVLLTINELFRSASASEQPIAKSREISRVQPILQFIQAHLAEQITLDRLANHFYLNKYHLGDLFKQATGFTVNEYIIHRRILRARELLRQQLPVHQVGAAVGFYNTPHFIRTFKKLVGTTPKQYQLR